MKNDKKLVIIGSGETALIAYEYFTYDSEYEVVAFSVNEQFLEEEELYGLPVVAFEMVQQVYPPSEYEAFVAISSGKLNRNRAKVFYEAKEKGYQLASYLSSNAFIWRNVEIGENCFIFEGNNIQPFVKIGNNVTLWSGNHIGHNTIINDHCFISSHCVISGFCKIREYCFLGVNSTIENNTEIAKDNFLGAGVLIQKNTLERELYQMKQTQASKVNTYKLFRIKEAL